MTSQKRIEIAGASVPYRESGSGPPVVILDPGRLGMAELQDALSPAHRVVRLQPSAIPPAASLTDSELGVLLSQASDSIIGAPYTLLAASAAAGIALHQAQEAPDNITALVMLSPRLPLPHPESDDTYDDFRLLNETACAALVVIGSKDASIPSHAAQTYRTQMLNCHVAIVYDAGHNIMADRPAALTDVVADFIERGETFVVGRQSGIIHP